MVRHSGDPGQSRNSLAIPTGTCWQTHYRSPDCIRATNSANGAIKKAVYPLTVACAVSCRRPDLGASSSLFLPAMSRQPCGLHSPRGRATHMDVGNAASPSGTGAASYKVSQHATRNWHIAKYKADKPLAFPPYACAKA